MQVVMGRMVGPRQKREDARTDGGPQRGAHNLRRRCACDHTRLAWLSSIEGGRMFESAFAALSRARLIGAQCEHVANRLLPTHMCPRSIIRASPLHVSLL
mmetsp:Transcript_55152/g.146332  ORF Transcript_55152/g.146332 Transcript_55152/m.146332 type:complete len:100 (-) Transcript_55152:3396-3695(-)